jgi:hypothetical protein
MGPAISRSVQALEFAFPLKCSAIIDDEDHVLVEMELPDIDSVIPEHRYVAKKNGTVRQARRKASERQHAYAQYACGQALVIAAGAFAAAPTLAHVTVAAKTKYPGQVAKANHYSYLFEVHIPRRALDGAHADTVDAVDFLGEQEGTLHVASSGVFREIERPEWTTHLPPPLSAPPAVDAPPPALAPEPLPARAQAVPMQRANGSGGLALLAMCGFCVFSTAVCGLGQSSRTIARNQVAPAQPERHVGTAESAESRRIALRRLQARELTANVQQHDGSRKSNQDTAREVIGAARQAGIDCETAEYVIEEMQAKGHTLAVKRFEYAVKSKVCEAGGDTR